MAEISISVVRSRAEFAALQRAWNALFAASPRVSPFLHYDWLQHWLQLYGPEYTSLQRGLRILLIRKGGELVGALPLFVRRGSYPLMGRQALRFIGTGEQEFEETCPEYLDLLHLPGEEETCLDALQTLLLEGDQLSWRELHFDAVPDSSPLVKLAERMGLHAETTVSVEGTCPIADLTGGWDAYLARLSSQNRSQYRRLLRQAVQAGARLEQATLDQVDHFFEDLVLLHQQRWLAAGKPGCFGAERFRWFHHALAQGWVPSGQVVLARLTHARRPLAVIYGFLMRGHFYFYQSGVRIEEEGPVRYPGLVAHLFLMQQLAARGVQAYDFLKGESFYKHKFATAAATLQRIVLHRPSWVHFCRHALSRAASSARRCAGSL
jgi:CelD/BcsL family acetyltransferase involved in cellulose biosynthesis